MFFNRGEFILRNLLLDFFLDFKINIINTNWRRLCSLEKNVRFWKARFLRNSLNGAQPEQNLSSVLDITSSFATWNLTYHNNLLCIKKDFMAGCHKNLMRIIFEIPLWCILISYKNRYGKISKFLLARLLSVVLKY